MCFYCIMKSGFFKVHNLQQFGKERLGIVRHHPAFPDSLKAQKYLFLAHDTWYGWPFLKWYSKHRGSDEREHLRNTKCDLGEPYQKGMKKSLIFCCFLLNFLLNGVLLLIPEQCFTISALTVYSGLTINAMTWPQVTFF